MMKAYIHGYGTSSSELDFKQVVPNALMRRRMSRIVRNGVLAGYEAQQGEEVDAILTATSLGCLSDSEKFLRNVIDTEEQLLSPTSFIQSTFNTIGATIALLQGNHCYNMTYTHGRDSLMTALLDAVMMLEEGTHQRVLVGVIEEYTSTLKTLLKRMGVSDLEGDGGAYFLMLTSSSEDALAELELDAKAQPATDKHFSNPLQFSEKMVEALRQKENLTLQGEYIQLKMRCL